jgi:hypothetical protein
MDQVGCPVFGAVVLLPLVLLAVVLVGALL